MRNPFDTPRKLLFSVSIPDAGLHIDETNVSHTSNVLLWD